MPSVDDGRYVDIDDIAVTQHLVTGNAVADHVVDRRADGFRETPIVEWRRNGAPFDSVFMTQLVKFASCYVWFYVGYNKIEYFRPRFLPEAGAIGPT